MCWLGNAQRGAVFHQVGIADVGHLGTAHALVDPAHHVAEYALGIVFQFLDQVALLDIAFAEQGNGENIVEAGAQHLRQLLLAHRDINLVVVHRMQAGGDRRRHPGGIGAGARMRDLFAHHRAHVVGGGPHALADLRRGRPCRQDRPDIHVPVLVGEQPGEVLISFFGIIAPASMLVWISSPVRSRKPVLMKITRSRAAWMQPLRLTVVRRSSSMMPILTVFALEAERLFHQFEQAYCRPRQPPRGRASWA